jgi:hypothetical protein
MSEDPSKLACESFQSQISELLASGTDIENHAHIKVCAVCGQLLQEIKSIAENARHLRFGTNGSDTDDWSETT